MEGSTKLVVDGVTYFQCVFTLPGQLSSLALGNRKLMYDLLFKAAWESLKTKVECELGIQAGCLAERDILFVLALRSLAGLVRESRWI